MDFRAIGIFDSGVGGLSILSACMKKLPHERFLYIFDKSHAPYGNKSDDYIRRCALNACQSLCAAGCKAIVIACNTATTAALGFVRSRINLPVVGTYPPVGRAVRALTDGKALILTTAATASKLSGRAVPAKYGADKIILAPQKMLAEKIEEHFGCLNVIRPYVYSVLERYENVQSVAIGCTHYSFISGIIGDYYGKNVRIFDPAEYVAEKLRAVLVRRGIESPKKKGGVKFCFT